MKYGYVSWDKNEFEEFYNLREKFKAGQEVIEDWKFHETSVKKGDRIFVYKIKSRDDASDIVRGIVAAGHAVSDRFKSQENGGEPSIKLKFDYFADFENGEILDVETINSIFGNSDWIIQKSGHMFPDENKYDIELAWAKTVGIKNDAYNLLKVCEEIEPDTHDGSYELVREAVTSFSNLQDRSVIDNKDLDLIYRFSVITTNKETHINAINNTHLSQEEKNRLINIVNGVWNNVARHSYSNSKGSQVGMFGNALHTYNKSINDNDLGQKIIEALIYIKDHDDAESYEYIKENLNTYIKGIGHGSFSTLAHCLKPNSFPIVNGNQGKGNVYKDLGISLIESNVLKDYAINCEKIKEFRDANFTFKNYRVVDLVSGIDDVKEVEVPENENGIFIVFQRAGKNGLFAKESAAGILEAPKKDKGGKTPPHWKRMENIEKDDLIFHMSDQKIAAVSIAKDKAHDDAAGTSYIVDSEYTILENKLDLDPLRATIIKECRNFDNAPFNKKGTGNQGYLFDMPPGLSDKFIDEIIASNPSQDLDFLNKYKNRVKESNTNNNSEGVNKMANFKKNISLNTILYGPPGTGKTYNSKVYAVAICNYNGDLDAVKNLDYKNDIIPAYNKLVEEGRVAFTTFHQSYGYEEFIEGIKPVLKDDDTKEVYYDVIPGLFKKFCDDALISEQNMSSIGVDENAPIWKMSLYGGKTNILKECFDENYLRIGFDKNSGNNSLKLFMEEMHAGDIVLSLASFYEINGIAQIVDENITELNNKTEFKIARKIKWLFKNKVINIKDINGGNRLPIKTCSGLPNINRAEVFKLINEEAGTTSNLEVKPRVFIIDEINRGNISKIFGELITLIEASKRKGEDEAMSCVLPYSKQKFSVPNNVYILGTMNTADRSIALMDTALRRRFDFIEMMPDVEVDFMKNLKVGKIDIKKMLQVMNNRIEVLYDREHTLGHAFFKDVVTLEDLGLTFENKIIPLLQEYFFEDYEKIALVLGDNAKTDKNYKFIVTEDIDANIFRNGDIPDSISDKRVSKLNLKEAIKHEESYIQIYE